MDTKSEGINFSKEGILEAQHLVKWKHQQGILNVPASPSKVIISPQYKAIRKKHRFFSKQIKGLMGTHLCMDAERGIYLSGGWGIGAPALIAVCEELHALGAKEFYLLGVCGRLTAKVKEGETVIATSALREEGTSGHYLPASAQNQVSCPDQDGTVSLSHSLSAQMATFVSTDAPYRETMEKYNSWCSQDASIVDMETAALYAFGNFYNIKTYALGITADSLAEGKWQMAHDYRNVEKLLSRQTENLIKILMK